MSEKLLNDRESIEEAFDTLAKIAKIARLMNEVKSEIPNSYEEISALAIGYAKRLNS